MELARMPTKQALLLVAAIGIAAGVYVFAVRHFQRDAQLEQHAFSVGTPPADRVEVTAQIIGVSPVKNTLHVRFGFEPVGKYAADRFGRVASDITIVVATADGYLPIRLAAGEIPVATDKDIELADGSTKDYPFDRYTARLGVEAFERARAGKGSTPIPTVVHYEEDLGNYGIAAELGPESSRGFIDVHLVVWRSAAIVTFSMMMYAALILVSASVLVFTVLVVLGRVAPDFAMMLWSGAMLFALPAVRNSLPDSPPLGIQSDYYIFMWSETAVALSMVTLTSYLIAHRARAEPKGDT